MSAEQIDGARVEEFLRALAARLDAIYPWRETSPTIEDVIDDCRDFHVADNDPQIQHGLGWLRGAAEAQGLTVREFLWEYGISDDQITAPHPRVRAFPTKKPKTTKRKRKGHDHG